MARIDLGSVTKRFEGHAAVDSVSLQIASGTFVAVLGPSGCGKTTLLRLLAGFERADGGTIRFDDVLQSGDGNHAPPEQRGLGMVFQSYALWPHMSVAENVGYPLRVKGESRDMILNRAAAALDQVGMSGFESRRPAELSGGQRQRVALARCLVTRPGIVLFDEPLANLDVHLRESMQAQFRRFHEETGATIVYVTHDQAEAMALADQVVVMDAGVVQQVAEPRRLYAEPANEMVARFVGRGMMTDCNVVGPSDDGRVMVELLGERFTVRGQALQAGPARVCLRPEWLTLSADGIRARVVETVYRGAATTLTVVPTADPAVELQIDSAELPPAIDSEIGVAVQDGWCLR